MENKEFHGFLAAVCQGAGPSQWLLDELERRLPASWTYEVSGQRCLVRGYYEGHPSQTVRAVVQSFASCESVGWRHISGDYDTWVCEDTFVYEILAARMDPFSAVLIELTLHPTQDDELTLAPKNLRLGKEGSKRLMASRRKR